LSLRPDMSSYIVQWYPHSQRIPFACPLPTSDFTIPSAVNAQHLHSSDHFFIHHVSILLNTHCPQLMINFGLKFGDPTPAP
jgi:hypothetical protein